MLQNLKRTDHLILLVGTNPLPNYVAAKLLLNENGRLHLLYSADTAEIAERLEILLGQEATRTRVDESDAGDIAEKMTRLVQNIGSGSIGLHYTGGTKVMAVHAHRAFLGAMKQHHFDQKPVCSYLDARSYKMKFDPQPGYSGFDEKVLQAEKVDLETVLALHDIPLTKSSLNTTSHLHKTSRVLANLHTNPNTAGQWRTWCDNELKPKTWHLLGSKKSQERKLAAVTLNLPTEDDLQVAVESILTELGLPMNHVLSLSAPQIAQVFGKPRRFCRWLDGIWLENYVFDEISAIAEQAGLNDVAMSLDTIRDENRPDFEFDVGVMKGYQLFGLSCSTTLDKKRPKSKLFEAYIRVKQLGGDEARVGLVCPQHGLKKKLEKELPESVQGKVRIFDSAHLENLRAELQDWFEHAK